MSRNSATVVLVSLLTATVAVADDDLDGQFVKAGPNLGLAIHGDDRGTGVVAGAEAAYTYFRGRTWTGGTGELARDFAGDDSTRWAVGPKLGYLFAGLDLRYAGERNGGRTRHGYNVRLRLTVALGGLYFGVTDLRGDVDGRFVEIGAQFKLGPRIAP